MLVCNTYTYTTPLGKASPEGGNKNPTKQQCQYNNENCIYCK